MHKEVDIADLYPVEDAADELSYFYYLKMYKKQKQNSDICDSKDSYSKHIRIFDMNGSWLVTDGNSRVLAAKMAGFEKITAVEEFTVAQDIGRKLFLKNTLERRIQLKQKGFENYEANRSEQN